MKRFTDTFKQKLRDGGIDDDEIRYWEVAFNDCRASSEMIAAAGNCDCSSCKREGTCGQLGNIPVGGGECPWGAFDPK
jgi:hypothetical protein